MRNWLVFADPVTYSSVDFRLSDRACMGEVLTQVWLKSVKKWVSYLTKTWMHKKSWKHFQGSRKLPQAHKKVCDEINKKNDMRVKILLMEGSTLLGEYEKLVKTISTNFSSMILDIMKILAICLVNGWIGAKQMVFWAWAHKWAP